LRDRRSPCAEVRAGAQFARILPPKSTAIEEMKRYDFPWATGLQHQCLGASCQCSAGQPRRHGKVLTLPMAAVPPVGVDFYSVFGASLAVRSASSNVGKSSEVLRDGRVSPTSPVRSRFRG